MGTLPTNFEVTLSLEHLGQSVQQHLRAFGYFNEDTDFFVLKNVKPNKDGTVSLKGLVVHD